MSFSDIPGFNTIKNKLVEMSRINKVPHAQLLVGPQGSAALPLAFAFIKFAECDNNKDASDSCGECSSCKKIENFNFPDIYYSFPIAKSPKLKNPVSIYQIKKWKEFLLDTPYSSIKNWSDHIGETKSLSIYKEESREIIKFTNLNSLTSKRYVLIWLPEYMHISTANALLKTFEEPLKNIYFILVSNDYEKIPVTITSRMQAHYLQKFDNEEVSQYLIKKLNLSLEKAGIIARLADGDMSEALKIGTSEDLTENFNSYKDWLRACYAKKYDQLITLSETFGGLDKESQKLFCEYSIKMMRNVLLNIFDIRDIIYTSEEEIEFLNNISEYLSIKKIQHVVSNLENFIQNISSNANAKINFLDMSIKFSKIFR